MFNDIRIWLTQLISNPLQSFPTLGVHSLYFRVCDILALADDVPDFIPDFCERDTECKALFIDFYTRRAALNKLGEFSTRLRLDFMDNGVSNCYDLVGCNVNIAIPINKICYTFRIIKQRQQLFFCFQILCNLIVYEIRQNTALFTYLVVYEFVLNILKYAVDFYEKVPFLCLFFKRF